VKHQNTLQHLLGQPICEIEFNDDRLGILLRRLSDTKAWESIENDLWQSTVTVYEIEMTGVRLDSTTTYGYHNGYHNGYHTPTEDGLMQHGYSKDHRPDLPQLKLMAAAAEPSGHLFQKAISEVLERYKVKGLLNVTWQRQEESIIRYVGRGRGSADRPQRTESRVRYVIIGVHRDEEALQRYRDRLGWSVHVTTVPEERMSLTEAVKHYRGGWSLERVSIW